MSQNQSKYNLFKTTEINKMQNELNSDLFKTTKNNRMLRSIKINQNVIYLKP